MKRRQFLTSTLGAAVAASLPARYALASPELGQRAVDARRGDGTGVTLEASALEDLRGLLQGRLLLAQDEGYEDARRVYNPIINKRPALIVQVLDVADVRAAVNFARQHGLLLAVKGGGHSFSGQSTCDAGMLIDLSRMRGVRVDPVARRAWVAGGSLLGMVDHECQSHGLVVPLGTYAGTGVGGLTTGGGFGRVARRWGLTLDQVRSVDVVTADGRFVHADERNHRELLWAVRGGGGNFGIITTFEFELHPLQSHVVTGTWSFPFSELRSVLTAYGEYSQAAPDELYLDAGVSVGGDTPEGDVGVIACYSGSERDAEKVLQPIRRFGKVRNESVTGMTYLQAQGANAETDVRFKQAQFMSSSGIYMKTGFVDGINAELAKTIEENVQESHPKRNWAVFFQHAGGAIGRVAPSVTAFGHRDASHNMLARTDWAVGEDNEAHISNARQRWQALERFTRGYYINDMTGDEATRSVNDNYRDNYPRLLQIKRQYDPGNLFRLNANINPSMS